MKKQSEHTPTPWNLSGQFITANESAKELKGFGLPVQRQIGKIHDSRDAAFIVRAVNAHGLLVSTFKWLQDEIDENGQGNLPDALVSAIRRAITKAEGR